MIGKVSAVVLAGLLLAAAAAAPDALARRGAGPSGGRAGIGNCRQLGNCPNPQQQQQRLRDGSCPQDPSQCPSPENCPGPGVGGRFRGARQGAGGR